MVTRTRRLVIGLLTAATLGIDVVTAGEQGALPAASTLVARHVEAIGGEDAWRRVSSWRASGLTELPAQNVRGTFEMLAARPDRLIIRMDLAGIGKAETGFNGVVGWLLDPMVGPSLVTGGPLEELRNDAQFDALLHPPSLVTSLTTTARSEFDGRPAFKVAVTYASGHVRDEFFDADTGLLLGSEFVADTPIGKVPSRIVLRDYRLFGSIKQPGRIIQSSMGIEQHFLVQSVELNAVPPAALEPPPVIKALIKTDVPEPWRVQALASFDEAWSTIAETFYDPTFDGLDWPGVRLTLRPKVEAARDADAAREVIRQMLGLLRRSHFALISPESPSTPLRDTDAFVPIETRLLADAVVITGVEPGSDAHRVGLRPGLILQAVDEDDVRSWLRETDGLEPRMRAMQVWRRVQRSLQGPDHSEAALRVVDGERTHSWRVRRVRPTGDRIVLGDLAPFHVRVFDRSVETSRGRAVGIVGFNVWMASANDQLAEAIDRHRASAGIVLDLRGNPGGLAAMIRGVAGHLFAEPVSLGRIKTRDAEVEFPANPRLVMPDGRRVQPFGGPVAILVDELTASASECFAGGLQSLGRARVFGRTSAGQALPASTRRLPNGDVLMYVVGDFVTGSGRRLEGVGVVPDEVVPLQPDALRQGRDPDLEAALRWLDSVG